MSLFLIIHIIIAFTGIGITSFLLISPNKRKLDLSTIFLAATLATGTVLVVNNPAHMLQSCVMGILYTAFVVGGIAVSRKRMAKQHLE